MFLRETSVDGTEKSEVLPGHLLGPVVGLTFSKDGALLFASSGSSLWVYRVCSGEMLASQRVLAPGAVVTGLDVDGEDSTLVAVFGDRCVRIVDGVPTGKDVFSGTRRTGASCVAAQIGQEGSSTNTGGKGPPENCSGDRSTAANHPEDGDSTEGGKLIPRCPWFRAIAEIPELDDRVWDARLIRGGDRCGDHFTQPENEQQVMEKAFGNSAARRLVAIALAHNYIEVWDWMAARGPSRLWRSHGVDTCLLYHARLWGRTLAELRVASGTVFNQVLVWRPGGAGAKQAEEGQGKLVAVPGQKNHIATLGEGRGSFAGRGLLRLEGHEGVIFRIAWREDGKQVASVSDDRTVRVWDVEHQPGYPNVTDNNTEGVAAGICDNGTINTDCPSRARRSERAEASGRLLWTGWGHSSRVWDVAFSSRGLVTSGEDGTAVLWGEDLQSSTQGDGIVSDGQGGQLVPIAIMRGHGGSHVWRVAAHYFPPRGDRSERGNPRQKSYRGERWGNDVAGGTWDGIRGLALLATGGNDGAIKLWDLDFEAACQTRERQSIFRGETKTLLPPSTSCLIPDVATSSAMAKGSPTKVSASKYATTSAMSQSMKAEAESSDPPPLNAAPASCVHPSAAAFTFQAGGADVALSQTEGAEDMLSLNKGQRKQAGGGRSRQERVRRRWRRRQYSIVVREVRLCRYGTAAAILLADGSVWWVEDLALGSWEQVSVAGARCHVGDREMFGEKITSRFDQRPESRQRRYGGDQGGAIEGVTLDGRMLRDKVSAIAILEISVPPDSTANSDDGDVAHVGVRKVHSRSSEEAGTYDKHGCRRNDIVVVAGCDDGWLFLLTRRRLPFVEPYSFRHEHRSGIDGLHDDEAAPCHGIWHVNASWASHTARVTGLWYTRGVAGRKPASCSNPQPFLTAALDTSRLRPSAYSALGVAGVDGALISAAADGTLAWWEWAGSKRGFRDRDGVVGHVTGETMAGERREDPETGDGVAEQARPALRMRSRPMMLHIPAGFLARACGLSFLQTYALMRQMCSTGSDAAVSSFVIDDVATLIPKKGALGVSSPGGVLFCGQTKGDIRCFIGSREIKARSMQAHVDSSISRAGVAEASVPAGGGVPPCLVLRRQHGKDQVSRLALLGDCLLSAGHDGHVKHYVISYRESVSSSVDDGDTAKGTDVQHELVSTSGKTSAESVTDRRDIEAAVKSPPDTAITVVLTLVTSYPTTPITAIFDLWVSGESFSDDIWNKDSPKGRDKRGKLRVVVAGRSGSSKTSVWDIGERRQLLELECGEKHLAHDLHLSWPDAFAAPCPSPSNARVLPGAERTCTCDGSGICSKDSNSDCFQSRAVACSLPLHSQGRALKALSSPTSALGILRPSSTWLSSGRAISVLPRHTAVFATTESAAINAIGTKSGNHEASIHGSPSVSGALMHGFGNHDQAIPQSTGLRLAFNSSIMGSVQGMGESLAHRARWPCSGPAVDSGHSLPGGIRIGRQGADLVKMPPMKEPGTAEVPVTSDRGDRARAEDKADPPASSGRYMGAAGDEAAESTKFQFAYSISEPFHAQRVASVRFLPGSGAVRARTGDRTRRQAGARLVTGGEDGTVKLVDVLFPGNDGRDFDFGSTTSVLDRLAVAETKAHGASDTDNTHGCSSPWEKRTSTPFCSLPHAKVVQTLPPHESSVGAIAVASEATWPTRLRNEEFEFGGKSLIFSGGGKMELRAWVADEEHESREWTENLSVPPLRWMLTMTPATRSPLHAHRIMCLCALPKAPHRLNPMRMPLDLNNNNRGETEERLVVAGDSGGGVAIFVIRGGGPGDCSDNGLSSFPAGRWMTASGRPVLCVTNVRVVPQPVDYRSRVKGPGRAPTSAKVSDVHGCSRTRYSLNPMVHDGGGGGELPSGQDQAVSHGQEEQNVHEQNLREDNSTASMGRGHGDSTKAPASRAVDLVVTGDTSGVVTVWRLAYDEASISSRHAAGKYNTRGEVRGNANSCGGNGQAPSDFVHRGSEGRRRGSVGILKNGKGAPQPDLVYVMEYRAHQMGVLCIDVARSECGGSIIVTTGGDDQAICVAEITFSIDDNRRPSASLFRGAPEMTEGAASSAIKGIALVAWPQHPPQSPSSTGPIPSTMSATFPGKPPCHRRRFSSMMSIIGVSRDQRLSRWDLKEVLGQIPSVHESSQHRCRASLSSASGEADEEHDDDGRDTEKGTLGRRWKLEWRAGCITDVCDVSDIDVTVLSPLDRASYSHGECSATAHTSQPDLGENPLSGTLAEAERMVAARQNPEEGYSARIGREEAQEVPPSWGLPGLGSPTALVAVSGQGLQLVLFRGDGEFLPLISGRIDRHCVP